MSDPNMKAPTIDQRPGEPAGPLRVLTFNRKPRIVPFDVRTMRTYDGLSAEWKSWIADVIAWAGLVDADKRRPMHNIGKPVITIGDDDREPA